MSPELAAMMVPMLEADEGLRLVCYDDATGDKIVPGSVVRGHVTIGIGRALDVNGITEEEAGYLLTNDLVKIGDALDKAIPWWSTLSLQRQAVLCSMAFQLGIGGLLGFKTTLSAMQSGAYAVAAAGMLASTWATQTPKRAKRLASLMRGGSTA